MANMNLSLNSALSIYGSGSSSGMHVSGHGYQEDLKLMLSLMEPIEERHRIVPPLPCF